MKVTIENVKEKQTRWQSFWEDLDWWGIMFPRTYYKLYVTLHLTNEEKLVIKETRRDFVQLVEGDPHNEENKPSIYAMRVATGKRTCVFKHKDIQWVNRMETLVGEGLKKWKEEIDSQAPYFEKRAEKKSYEL